MTAIFPNLHAKNVLLTGHTGFKGSWLALWLSQLGANVTGYSLAPHTTPSNYHTSNIRELLHHEFIADIRDQPTLQKAFHQTQPDLVLHLAAQAIVRESYHDPHATFDTNVLGTSAVLNAVRLAKKPMAVVVVTSDKCYDNKEQIWGYRESDELGGFDPYSASKGAAEIVTNSYRTSFFNTARLHEHKVKLASARAGNVIGGGDWAKDRIVTDLVHSLANNKPVPVRNPRSIRPWEHLLEPLSGYLALADRMLASDDPVWCSAWNFGPCSGTEAPVSVLVESFIKHWGSGAWSDCSNPEAPHEAAILRLSIEKAMSLLHWRPQWNLDETVRRTASWYRRFHADPVSLMRAACLADIQAYEQSMLNNLHPPLAADSQGEKI